MAIVTVVVCRHGFRHGSRASLVVNVGVRSVFRGTDARCKVRLVGYAMATAYVVSMLACM
jgi:hypothetical protein